MREAIERILAYLGNAVRYSPLIAIVVFVLMIIVTPILAMSFGLLYVSAGGEFSLHLMSTLLVGGALVGFTLAGALILKLLGVRCARHSWIALVGAVIMAGVLFRGLNAIPTAGAIWTTVMWSGFAAVVVATLLLVLFGTMRRVRPLFVIGVILMTVGALSGAVKWAGSRALTTKRSREEKVYKFCWVKPPELVGSSSVRSWCGKVRIGLDTEDSLSFTVYDQYDRTFSYTLDRVSSTGQWKANSGEKFGFGVWEELLVAQGSRIKILGRFKDFSLPDAEKSVWQQLYIE